MNKDGAMDDLSCRYSTSCSSVVEGGQDTFMPEDVNDHSNDDESEVNDTMNTNNITFDSYEFDYETPFGTDTKLSFDLAMVDLLKKRISNRSTGNSFAALRSNAD